MSTELNFSLLIDKQLTQLQQLEVVIDQEKEILQQQNPENLVDITEKKNQLLLTIQELDLKFEQSILFKQEKSQGLFDDKLAVIEEILLRCKDKNHINGQIIAQSQLSVERMKTSLLQNHNKASMTYDKKGKTSGGLSSLGIKA